MDSLILRLISFTCLIIKIYFVKCETIYTQKKFDTILQNYLKPMRRISDFFPNRAVELQLEMDGKKARIMSAPTKPDYVRLEKMPKYFLSNDEKIARPNDMFDARSTNAIVLVTPESTYAAEPRTTSATIPPTFPANEVLNQLMQVRKSDTNNAKLLALASQVVDSILTAIKPSSQLSDVLNQLMQIRKNNNNNSEEKLISWKDLKAIMGEINSGIKMSNSENEPVKKRDLWIALGMKYGLKCNDGPKLRNNENPPSEKPAVTTDSNLQKILDILKEGKIVDRNANDPNMADDLHWFKVKVPKNAM